MPKGTDSLHHWLNVEFFYERLQGSSDTSYSQLSIQHLCALNRNAKQYQYNDVVHRNLVPFETIDTNILDRLHTLSRTQSWSKLVKLNENFLFNQVHRFMNNLLNRQVTIEAFAMVSHYRIKIKNNKLVYLKEIQRDID